MTDAGPVDERGPVDWLVVEFRDRELTARLAPTVVDLVGRRLVRVLDIVVVHKDDDGVVTTHEVSDADPDGGELTAFQTLDDELDMLLTADDVRNVAQALEPGSSAAVLVWENTWSLPFARTVRELGGHVLASGRLGPDR